jgi:hypothetical protein
VATGAATIIATVGGYFDTCTVTVTPAPVTGVELSAATLNLDFYGSSTLRATVSPSNAGNKAVTWSSSDEAVATVSSTGQVYAVGVGTARITATTVDGSFADTCVVTTPVFTQSSGDMGLYLGNGTTPVITGTIESCLANLDMLLETSSALRSMVWTIKGNESSRLIHPVTLGGSGSAQRGSGNAMVFPYLDALTSPLIIQVNGGASGATLDLAQPGNMFSFASDVKVDATFENITFRGLYKTDEMPEGFRASTDSSRNSGTYAAYGNYLSGRYKSLINIEGATTVTLKNSSVTGNYGGEANNPEDPGIFYYGGGVSVMHPGKLILDSGGRVAYNVVAPNPAPETLSEEQSAGGGIGGNGTVEL